MLLKSDDDIIGILNSGSVVFTRISQCDSKLPTYEQLYVRVTVCSRDESDWRKQLAPRVIYLKGQMSITENQGPEVQEAKLHPTSSNKLIHENNPKETENHSEMHGPLINNDLIPPKAKGGLLISPKRKLLISSKGELPNRSSNFDKTTSSKPNVNTRPYQGSHCNAGFHLKKSLAVHKRIHIGERPAYQCSFCDKTFLRKQGYNDHLRKYCVENRHSCNLCDKVFSRYRDIKDHMKIHKLDHPYQCSLCEKAFIVKTKLDFHMKYDHVTKHTPLKPYQCRVCAKNCLHNEELMLHMFIHTGEKPFPCSLCDKSFLQNSDLKKHMETHTNTYTLERPFQCDICDKAFSTESNLKYHLLTYHKVRPYHYQCTLCAKVFFKNTHLEDHITSVHKGNIIQTMEKQLSCDQSCENLISVNRFDSEYLCESKIEIKDEDIDFERSCTELKIEVKVEEINI